MVYNMKVIIIGATNAAVTAAARLRRLDEKVEIIIIDHRRTVPEIRLGRLQDSYNVVVRLGMKAVWDDEAQDSLVCEDLVSGEVTSEKFDKIVFSYEVDGDSVAHAHRGPRNSFVLSNPAALERSWNDIATYMIASSTKTAEVRGNDLIAFMAVARLIDAKILTIHRVVNMPPQSPHVPDLDKDVAAHIIAHLVSRGMHIGDVMDAHDPTPMSDGIIVDCVNHVPQLPEFVQPADNKQAAQEFPLDTIVTNKFTGERADAPQLSQKRGRDLAAVVLGYSDSNADSEESVNLRSVDLLGKRLTTFGLTEHELNRRGMKHIFSVVPIGDGFLKLIYNDLGQILGFAALAASPNPTKYADMLAMFVQLGGMVHKLANAELSDDMSAVIALGKIAQNVLEKRLEMAYWDEIEHVDMEKTILLDVRGEREYATGSIPNAINIPLADLRIRQYLLDETKEVIVFCDSGRDSYVAARILAGCGMKVRHLTGGLAYCGVLLKEVIL